MPSGYYKWHSSPFGPVTTRNSYPLCRIIQFKVGIHCCFFLGMYSSPLLSAVVITVAGHCVALLGPFLLFRRDPRIWLFPSPGLKSRTKLFIIAKLQCLPNIPAATPYPFRWEKDCRCAVVVRIQWTHVDCGI